MHVENNFYEESESEEISNASYHLFLTYMVSINKWYF